MFDLENNIERLAKEGKTDLIIAIMRLVTVTSMICGLGAAFFLGFVLGRGA